MVPAPDPRAAFRPCQGQFHSRSRLVSVTRERCPLSGLTPFQDLYINTYTTFRKLHLFPSCEGSTPTLLGPLESANLNQ
jgi:hypothetical protein